MSTAQQLSVDDETPVRGVVLLAVGVGERLEAGVPALVRNRLDRFDTPVEGLFGLRASLIVAQVRALLLHPGVDLVVASFQRGDGTAGEAGFDAIKVNAVIMRNVNEDEIADFADFAREHDIDMRFIGFMPLDSSRTWDRSKVVTADEMLEKISTRHELVPLDQGDPHSTSLNYTFADGAPGRIGIIAPVTRVFCGACSRLRITADGKVRPCLFSHKEWDIRPVLRSGGSDEDIAAFLRNATWTKQKGHGISEAGFVQPERTMSAIGG